MAEVNLKVSGLNGNSPDGSPECVVTRRLYRNGDSEYLMNGNVCRLRDIHELFMDTGLGSKAYSIIEQGKIGLILSSKPADRRALIEEAAGITKYKARRRQTQLKLEAAQQNLLRVNDIVHEVEKQLESLKRQASKARRYRVVREEMQGVERVLFGRRFLDLEAQARLPRRSASAVEAEREQAAAHRPRDGGGADRGAAHRASTRTKRGSRRCAGRLARADARRGPAPGPERATAKQQIAEAETRAEEAAREAAELRGARGPAHGDRSTRGASEDSALREDRCAAEDEARAAEPAVQARQRRARRRRDASRSAAREAQVGLLGRIAALAERARLGVGHAPSAPGPTS